MMGDKEVRQSEEAQKEYVELDTSASEGSKRITVQNYSIEDFSDIKNVLDALREGYTIAVLNIRPLRETDTVDLQRAINKLKKTTEAINGDIAGLGEDYIIVTPEIARIARDKKKSKSAEVQKELDNSDLETY
ncbi:MAG: cell division protein SepF [Candidatus Woesearchaeota archaeon]